MMTTRLKALAIAAILAVVACSTTQPRITTVEPSISNLAAATRVVEREYPLELKNAGIEGTVMVQLSIDTLGVVRNALLAKSSGYFELDEAALRAARFFKFNPALSREEKVEVWSLVPVTFGSTTQPLAIAWHVLMEPNNQAETRVLTREYPSAIRDAGIGGTVMVALFIDTLGVVRNTSLNKSSGYSALDEAALRAARFFKFNPALSREEKVEVWIRMPVTFGMRPPR